MSEKERKAAAKKAEGGQKQPKAEAKGDGKAKAAKAEQKANSAANRAGEEPRDPDYVPRFKKRYDDECGRR